eukprot:scaffold317_cov379-Prasinococcus_capsulatus_cf.AAC.1
MPWLVPPARRIDAPAAPPIGRRDPVPGRDADGAFRSVFDPPGAPARVRPPCALLLGLLDPARPASDQRRAYCALAGSDVRTTVRACVDTSGGAEITPAQAARRSGTGAAWGEVARTTPTG